jgi:serine/threonine-protein kinase
VDVTPFARPIPLAAGVHYVSLRHPDAPEEVRTVRVAEGESVLLDVTMRVDGLPEGALDAGAAVRSTKESGP